MCCGSVTPAPAVPDIWLTVHTDTGRRLRMRVLTEEHAAQVVAEMVAQGRQVSRDGVMVKPSSNVTTSSAVVSDIPASVTVEVEPVAEPVAEQVVTGVKKRAVSTKHEPVN